MTPATKQEKYSSSPLSPLDGGPNTRLERGEGEREGAIVIVELHNNTFLGALALLLSYLSSFLASKGSHRIGRSRGRRRRGHNDDATLTKKEVQFAERGKTISPHRRSIKKESKAADKKILWPRAAAEHRL